MLGPALVALVALSGDLHLAADGTSETRAGETPIVAGGRSQAFVAEVLTPLVALVYRDPGLNLELSYAPRIYWAHPNLAHRWAPLLLHTANLLFEDQVSPRFRALASVAGSIGEADYTTLPQLIGAVQGALPPIQSLASATARAGVHGFLTERWELELGAQGFYWKWLKAEGLPANTITSQASAAEQVTALYRLTPRHELGFGAAFGQAHYSYGLDLFTVGPTVTWKVRLSLSNDLRLTLGVAYVRAGGTLPPGTMPPLGDSGQAVAPVGAFEFLSKVLGRDQLLVSTRASGGAEYYFDPVLGSAVPRAFVDAGVVALMPPHWMATLKGGFATPIRTTPLVVAMNATPPDETAFTVTLAVRRRLSMNFFGEVGGLWADRGPALDTPNFHFHQRQLWIYIELIGTTRPLPTTPQIQTQTGQTPETARTQTPQSQTPQSQTPQSQTPQSQTPQ